MEPPCVHICACVCTHVHVCTLTGGNLLASSYLTTLAAENYQKENQQLLCIKLGIFILEKGVPGREMKMTRMCACVFT